MRNIFLALITIVMLGGTSSAYERKAKFNINTAVRGAQFIFYAKVVDISYGMSKEGKGYEVLPHTFVKFEIKKVLKGNPRQAQDKITLRFMGGRGEQALFFHPGEYPLFDIGDEDILFIRNNNKSGCPLLNCAEGLFRSISGKIYNDMGQQVVLTRKREVDFGVREKLQEVLTHQVSQTTLIRKDEESESEGKPEADLPIGEHFGTESFLGFVEGKVLSLYKRETLDKWPIFNSSDIRTPFFVKIPNQVRGKSIVNKPYVPITKPSERDLRELRDLEKNQGNPVLNK